jgi:hypothetical protein
MKGMVFGVLLGAAVVWAVADARPLAWASQRPGEAMQVGGDLLTMSAAAGEAQQITIVDPKLRTMTVYHVDNKSGVISLKSVRNITWDMQMVEFNATEPTPRELRSQR